MVERFVSATAGCIDNGGTCTLLPPSRSFVGETRELPRKNQMAAGTATSDADSLPLLSRKGAQDDITVIDCAYNGPRANEKQFFF